MRAKRFSLGLGIAVLSCMAALLIFSSHLKARSALDSSWGFSARNLDTTCKPCDNFYQFAMGGWMKDNPIPAEYATWGTFTQLRDSNLSAMRAMLEAAAKSNPAPGSNEQKIGDFYASCMDTSAIEAAGLKPIAGELAAIDAINDRKSLDAAIVRVQREGASVLFRFSSAQDIMDSTRVIATASQGGLGMPDRDYYFRDDDKSKQLRADYERHVAKMLELAGDAPDQAAAEAKTVVAIETALAKASRTRVELRDPDKNENPHPRLVLGKLSARRRRSSRRTSQRAPTRILQGDEPGTRQRFTSGMEDLSALACDSRQRSGPPRAICPGEFRFLRQKALRNQGDTAALEALRAVHRCEPRRSSRTSLR